MSQPLPMMSENEMTRAPVDEDAGFGSLACERGPLPMEAMDVNARIVGFVSEVNLRQTFVNTMDEPIEATYIFPLPDRAAVTRFRMEVNGRVVEGLIKERGQARRDYDQAIAAGNRAAITEEERPGVFTMRVGNLMPGEKATIELDMTGPLPVDRGDVTFRFPLVVAPRYIPGTPLSGGSVGAGTEPDTDLVPDASRITPPVLLPGYPNPVELSMRVDIDAAGLPLSKLRSSLHAISIAGEGGRRRVELTPGERLDRDFIVRFSYGDASVLTSLVFAPDAEGDEGTFLCTIVPPARQTTAQKPRDVIMVLDRSGSMGGWKMVAARRAAARMVDSLNDSDRFTVYAFDNTTETPPAFKGTGLVSATDRNRFRAVEFLATLDARGGTEMAGPLNQAAAQLSGGYDERERILVLVTDGQVGNEDHILRGLANKLKNVRVFTLGIDQAVNAAFLRRLASLGGGACELVETEDRLDEVMDKIHRRIATPVVTELRIEPAGAKIDPDSVTPKRIPDLFAGVPVLVSGRYRGKPRGGLAIQGRTALGDAWHAKVDGELSDNGAVTKIWARGRVRELEDEYVVSYGDRSHLETKIVATSLRFSVLCRFTAFVAVDEHERPNPGGGLHEITQPVEPPAGWDMFAQSAPVAVPPMAGAPAPGAMPTIMGAAGMGAPPSAPAPAPMSPGRRPPRRRAAGPMKKMAAKLSGLFGGGSGGSHGAGGSGGSHGAGGSRSMDRLEALEMEEAVADDMRRDDESIDLTPYLRRLEQALTAADAGADAAQARDTARLFAATLTTLAGDLESVGAASLARTVREAISKLLAAINAGDVETTLGSVTTELRRALEKARSSSGADRAFWK